MKHTIPQTWTATQKKQHDAQRIYMDELWKDSSLLDSGLVDDDEDATSDLPAHLPLPSPVVVMNDGPKVSKRRRVGS